jgi:hypothetical protein
MYFWFFMILAIPFLFAGAIIIALFLENRQFEDFAWEPG